MFQGFPAIATAGAPNKLLLDNYTGAQAIYSLRLLKTISTNKCIRVRRSSDNTEQDIGFLPTGLLDQSSLTTFIGANDAYVVTWYDQSGNGLDLTQADTTRQPRIVIAGTVVTASNSKVAIDFALNTTDRHMDSPVSTGWTDATNGEWSGYTVATYANYGLRCTVIVDGDGGAIPRLLWYSSSESNLPQAIAWNTGNTNFNDRTTAPATGIPILISSRRTATNVEVWAQNVTNGPLTTTGTPRVSISQPLRMGNYYASLAFPHRGHIQEFFCFPVSTDNRISISANINSYYSLY